MPKLISKPPKYRHHKASGQAVPTIQGPPSANLPGLRQQERRRGSRHVHGNRLGQAV